MNKDDLLERYLYEVIRRLPEKQKEDIKSELKTLIEDMLAERCEDREATEDDMVEVLKELGDPAKLAKEYRDGNQYLIGGEYYDKYIYVLKITLVCAAVGLVLSQLIGNIFQLDQFSGIQNAFISGMIEASANVSSVLIQVFAWVTIIFIIMERNHVKLNQDDNEADNFKPQKLPPVPYEKAIIKRTDTAVGIVFTVIFAIVIIFMPELFGATIKASDETFRISPFNTEIWRQVMPLVILGIGLELGKEIIKLIIGVYDKTVALSTVIINSIGLLITFIIFLGFDIWNFEFMKELDLVLFDTDIAVEWLGGFDGSNLTMIVLTIAVISYLAETLHTVYKTVKYGMK